MARSKQTNRSPLVAAASLAATALVVAGCFPASGALPEGSESVFAATPGPLAEFTNRIWGFYPDRTPAEQMAATLHGMVLRNELVAECMAEQGFTFYADLGPVTMTMSGYGSSVEPGTREFAQTYGYGVWTDPWQPQTLGPAPEDWVDRNLAAQNAMSPAEWDAYLYALSGIEPGQFYSVDSGGCHTWANDQVFVWADTEGQFAALNHEIELIATNVLADSRVLALDSEFSHCMADAGFPGHITAGSPRASVSQEWRELVSRGGGARNIAPSRTQDFITEEIALAVADHDCRRALQVDELHETVRHELEARFVVMHGSELEAWALSEEARRTR